MCAEGRAGQCADLALGLWDGGTEWREGGGVAIEGGTDKLTTVGALEEPVCLVVRAADDALLILKYARRVRDDGVVVDAYHLQDVENSAVSSPQRLICPSAA
jgi:hypothetical protein